MNAKEHLKRKKQNVSTNKETAGITLIALVITIIVLLILAGVAIAMLTGENGILSRAQETQFQSDYFQAEERMRLAYMSVRTEIMINRAQNGTYDARTDGDNLKTLVTKDLQGAKGWGTVTYENPNIKVTYTNKSLKKDGISTGKPANDGKIEFEIVLTEKDASLNVDGVAVNSSTVNSENDGLSSTDIDADDDHNGLQEVAYVPAETSASVVIPSECNGGEKEQKFTQQRLGVRSLKWYVLSSDDNGINLVSDPTENTIKFSNSGGYDNCLYYLNEIATKLCTNESYGVSASRVHALRLTDIKYAAEKMNGSSYNWDEAMILGSSEEAYNNGEVGKLVYTSNNIRYPQIYGTSTGEVSANNPMYDEEVLTNYMPISGDKIDGDEPTSATASKLRANYTHFESRKTIERLGTFGTSGIGAKLFDSSDGGWYWLASRSVATNGVNADFGLRAVWGGVIGTEFLALASNSSYSEKGESLACMYACRFVVSVPWSSVNVSDDGKVELVEPGV